MHHNHNLKTCVPKRINLQFTTPDPVITRSILARYCKQQCSDKSNVFRSDFRLTTDTSTLQNTPHSPPSRASYWAVYLINLEENWICRDPSEYGLNQWETTLQCNVVSHWLTPYQECSLTCYSGPRSAGAPFALAGNDLCSGSWREERRLFHNLLAQPWRQANCLSLGVC